MQPSGFIKSDARLMRTVKKAAKRPDEEGKEGKIMATDVIIANC